MAESRSLLGERGSQRCERQRQGRGAAAPRLRLDAGSAGTLNHSDTRVLVPRALSARAFALREAAGHIASLSGETMGTRWSVRVVVPAAGRLAGLGAGIQTVLDGVVAEMSNWEAQSDISRFNGAAPGAWQALPPDFLKVLAASLQVAEETDGAYDPTIGMLVDLWGFGPAGGKGAVPDADAIREAAAASGWRHVECDTLLQRARRLTPLALDFSGIAKGFGVDCVGAWLRAQGLQNFLAEVGGELVGAGLKPDGQPWWVDIETPPDASFPLLRVALHGLAVATSGDYRRRFEANGKRFAHSIDPRTGVPISNGVASVTVLHTECMLADAYATAITVMGPEAGLAFAAGRGIAVHIVAGTREWLSPALREMLV